jgi:hypothetical protein
MRDESHSVRAAMRAHRPARGAEQAIGRSASSCHQASAPLAGSDTPSELLRPCNEVLPVPFSACTVRGSLK